MDYQRVFENVKDGKIDELAEYLEEMEEKQVKFNPLHKDQQKRNIFHWACFLGQLEMAQWILDELSVDIESKDQLGYSALDLAFLMNYQCNVDPKVQMHVIKTLIDRGAKLSKQIDGETPLHWACYYGNKILIYYLLEMDYTFLFIRNQKGLLPIDYLFYHEKQEFERSHSHEIFNHVMKTYLLVKVDKEKNKLTNNGFFIERMLTDPWLAEQEPSIEHKPIQYIENQQKLVFRRQKSIKMEQPYFIQKYSVRERMLAEDLQINQEYKVPQLSIIEERSNPHQPVKTEPQFKIRSHCQPFQGTEIEFFETKMLYWAAFLNNIQLCLEFLQRKCSPFQIIHEGLNALHIACKQGNENVVNLFTESQYTFEQSNNKKKKKMQRLNKQQGLDVQSTVNSSTAFHLIIESINYPILQLLINAEADPNIINYRCRTPFEMCLNATLNKFNNNLHFKSFTDRGFLYVIQTKGKKKIEDDIVYVQLLNIKQNFAERKLDFGFTVFFRPECMSDEKHDRRHHYCPPFFFYVIRISNDTIYQLADKYNIQCYNYKKKLIEDLHYENYQDFEFPNDLLVFEEEFNLEKFVLEHLIIQHFPLPNKQKIHLILKLWDKEGTNLIIKDSISRQTNLDALKPLFATQSYFGPVIGYHFGFLTHLVGWLLFPSIIGLAFGLPIIIELNFNNKYIPLHALFMALWATLFLESWKRRETELTYLWDMYKFKIVEPPRAMYVGPYTLNKITNQVEERDPLTSFHRRAILDGPVIIFGLVGVIVVFFVFTFLQQLDFIVQNSILKILLGILNAVCMTVLSTVYKVKINMKNLSKKVVEKQVEWENHTVESTEQISYIIKFFIFEFVNSYIMVFYQAIWIKSSLQLCINLASITITKGLIQNFSSNGLPILAYRVIKELNQKFFEDLRKKILKNNNNQQNHEQKSHSKETTNNIESANHKKEQKKKLHTIQFIHHKVKQKRQSTFAPNSISDQKQATEILNIEEQIEMLEQIEGNISRQEQKNLIHEYTDIAIQYGYVTMFATAFPPAPFIFMINMYINLRFSTNNYCNIMRRERALASDSIGVWLQIFQIMSYVAVFVNCLVVGTTNIEQLNNLVGQGTQIRNFFLLLAVEHILLTIKYIISFIIDDSPDWVNKEMMRIKIQGNGQIGN